MPLIHSYKKRFQGVTLKSGYFYKFRYLAYSNDPKPVVIFLSAISGINENTGHQWRLLQCINFSYIKRSERKRFLKVWLKELEKTKNIKLTWRTVLARYPYLKIAIRRYAYKPTYYIKNLKEIELLNIEKEVVSTLTKDFSKKIIRKILSRIRKIGIKKKK